MPIYSSGWRVASITVLRLFAILFLFSDSAVQARTNEMLHQKLLAGEQISFSPSAPEDARTIDSNWIKEAALKHLNIEIHHAVIQGPLNVQDVIFEQEVKLDGCVLKNEADFSNATFKRDFSASDITFRSWAAFRGTVFEQKATLQRANFEGPIAFDDAHFVGAFDVTEGKFARASGTVIFTRVRFDDSAIFSSSQFDSDVHFISTRFGGLGIFPGVKFKGLAEFDRAHFLDTATFGQGPAYKRFNSLFLGKASFLETQFDSSVDFDGVVFGNHVDFSSAAFRSGASFNAATFKSLCSFPMTQFGSDAYFMGAKFLGRAVFTSAHVAGSLDFQAQRPLAAAFFGDDAQFTNLQVDNITNFGGGNSLLRGVTFGKKVAFDMAKLHGLSDFQGVEFRDDVDFTDAIFGNDTYFVGATFEGNAAFDRLQIAGAALFSPQVGVATSDFFQPARFLRTASFAGAHFGLEARFRGVRFEEIADFSTAHFDGDAHFEESVFLGVTSFRSTSFRGVYFSDGTPNEQFMKDVDLSGCICDRIRVNWQSLLLYPGGQPRIQPYDRQPYIELEEVLRKSGSAEDADGVYEERHRAEELRMKGIDKFWNRLYWLIANYGIDLSHEIYASLFFLGLGALLFSRPGAVLDTESGLETEIAWYEAWFLAIHQFLPFGLPVEPSWSPSRCRVWKLVRSSTYANFLRIIGWVLVPLAAGWLAGFLRHAAQ